MVRKNNIMPVGFHGDRYLLMVIDYITHEYNIDYFIETGTNVGSTLRYYAETYNNVICYSCEPDIKAYKYAKKNIRNLANAQVINKDSISFFNILSRFDKMIYQKKVLFWLDAHGFGFDWPLQSEISYITTNFNKAIILIDDFYVPDSEQFEFDKYEGQICSFEFINNFIKVNKYNLYYPCYSERTSTFHPLKGWGLIIYGYEDLLMHFPNKNIIRKKINKDK